MFFFVIIKYLSSHMCTSNLSSVLKLCR